MYVSVLFCMFMYIHVHVHYTPQSRDLFYLGQYEAMSILQGGGGFPFLAEAVYEYLSTQKCLGVSIAAEDMPNATLRFVIQKV